MILQKPHKSSFTIQVNFMFDFLRLPGTFYRHIRKVES